MAVSKLDYVTEWWSIFVAGVMTVVSVSALIYVFTKSKYRWVQFMLFLCLVQSVDTILLAIVLFQESRQSDD